MILYRLVAHTPNGVRLGPLPAPLTSSLSMPYNDLGGLTLSYPAHGPLADLLGQPMEVAAEVSGDDGQTWAEPANGRYLYLQDDRDPIRDDNWSVSCPGYGKRLEKAVVTTQGLNSSGQREFVNATPGTIFHDLFGEAQARGALEGMGFPSPNWAAYDTNGVAWPETFTVSYAPGTNLLTILQAMADNGWLDYRFNGRDLEVFVPDTALARDLTVGPTPVTLRPGRDLLDGPFRRTWQGLADTAYVQGDDLAWVEVSNPGAIKPWGRQETYLQAAGVTDGGTLTGLANQNLATSADARAEHTFTLAPTTEAEPLATYYPGDWVFVGGADGAATARMRVRQVTLSQDGEKYAANLVMNDRFQEADIATARRLNRLQNGGTNTTSGQVSSPVGADILRPAQVTGISGQSTAYLDARGYTWATIVLDWPDVVTNIDGTTATDVQFYEVWRRRQGEATYAMVAEVDGSAWSDDGYDPGDTWEFRVRAVDNVFNRGDLSPTYAILTALDTDPPPTPSQPLLDTTDGLLVVTWDGNTSAGNPYATPDLRYLEVHVSQENDFAPTQGANGPGSTWKSVIEVPGFAGRSIIEGLAVGTTYYVKFVPVDTSWNVGATSIQANITTAAATDGQPPTLPAGWAPTLEPLGVGALVARWEPVPNQDATVYDVYVDTDPTMATRDATTFVGYGATEAAIMAVPGGDLLVAETDYYVAVVPRDDDGSAAPGIAGPTRIRQAAQDLISADYAYLGKVSASQIESGQLTASVALLGSISTAATGRKITMGVDGLKGVDGAGNTVFNFPTDLSQGATLQADLTANSIDAIGKVSLRSNANEVKASAKVILQKGTTPPVSAPSVVQEWGIIQGNDAWGPAWGVNAGWVSGGSYDPVSERFYSVYEAGGDTHIRSFGIAEHDKNGTPLWHEWITDNTTYGGQIMGACRIGDVIYALMHLSKGPGYDLNYNYLRRWDANTKAVLGPDIAVNQAINGATGAFGPGNAGDLLYASAGGPGTNATIVKSFSTDGQTINWSLTLANSDFYVPNRYSRIILSVQRATDETGSDRILLTVDGSTQTFIYDAAGGRYFGMEFPTPYGEVPAFTTYDADRGHWVTASRASGRFFVHDGITWTTGTPTETWEASYTWYDGDTVGGTHETPMSPVTSYAQSKRARTTITVPPIPDSGSTDSPDRARIYLGYNAGARTDQWLQATLAEAVRTISLTTATFSGTNPPATSNFPDSTPGRIESGTGAYYMDGVGDARFRVVRDDTMLGTMLYFSGNNYGVLSGNWVRLPFNVQAFQSGNWGFVAGAQSYVVAPRTGWYQVSAQALWSWGEYGGNRAMQVTAYQGTGPNARLYSSIHTDNNYLPINKIGGEPLYLTAGQQVWVDVYADGSPGNYTFLQGNDPFCRLSILPISLI